MSGKKDRMQNPHGQSLLEFVIMLPLILTVIFMLIEIARVLHAWLGVENAARFAVRYAVTGEWNNEDCYLLFGDICDDEAKWEAARISSVKHAALAGSAAIMLNQSAQWDEAGFFKVTICSKPGIIIPPSEPFESYQCVNAEGNPFQFAGEPGEYVVIVVDFNHPLLVPIFSRWWPMLHLSSQRMARVEDYRGRRHIALPPDMPSPTASLTYTPLPSSTPSNTPTATITSTPSKTPTPTETPDCSVYDLQSVWVYDDDVRALIRNDGKNDGWLTGSILEWAPYYDDQRVNFFSWNGSNYYQGDDWNPPTSNDPIPALALPSGSSYIWRADFDGVATQPGLVGTFTVSLTIDYHCPLVGSITIVPPTPTNAPTPDCGEIYASNAIIEGDDFRVSVRNGNYVDAYLTGTTLIWPDDLKPNMYVNKLTFANTIYDAWDYYTSPVVAPTSNVNLPNRTSLWWEADFNNMPPEGLWGHFQANLTFQYPQYGLVCPVSASIDATPIPTATLTSTPTITFTPTITRTPTITATPTITRTPTKTSVPTKTPTPTITPTPDCSKLQVNNVRFNDDDFEFRIRNNNPMPAYLESSTLWWPSSQFAQQVFNYFRFNSISYYTVSSDSSPVSAFAPSMLLNAGSNPWWEADFDNVPDGGLQGFYRASLTFEFPGWGTCSISASLDGAIVPSSTPTPTSGPTQTPAKTATPQPTATGTDTGAPPD